LRVLVRPARVVRPWIALTLGLIALGIAVLGLWTALAGTPASAVTSDRVRVRWVLPDGPAWTLGVRPGQTVLERVATGRAEDWRLITRSGAEEVWATKTAMIASLRETEVQTSVAVLAAIATLLLLASRAATAGAVAVLGLVAARASLLASGDMAASTLAVLAALVAPAIWLLVWGERRRLAWFAGTVVLAGGGTWLALRFSAAEDPSMADPYTVSALAVTTLTWTLAALAILLAIAPTLRSRGAGYGPRRLGDIVVLGGVLAAVPVALAVGVPAISAFAVVLVVLVVYPLTRRRIGAMLDRLVLGDVRARTSVEAIERERQRVSREIHDQPLQQLATVIHRIAGRPGLEQEAAVLQDVSMQLRGVTVQLHPPTLTDLGLGPALEALAEDLGREASMPVRAIVHARPGSRAPGDVELAAYRIAQEALGNAIRHSAARRVTLDATVDAHRVSIEVTDDGVGLDGVAMGEALARGRMGLRSMAERAELVGGELRFEDARPGTRVRFRWPA
jgi:signal transduction histidine kinase